MYGGVSWPSYYRILGVATEASDAEIRRAYRKLAKKWHPDKWRGKSCHLTQAKLKFQQIQEAYSVLSDRRKRRMYDAGQEYDYEEDDVDEDEVEGFSEFVEEMVSLMEEARKQERSYSMEELQRMFWEMAQSFDFSAPPPPPPPPATPFTLV